MANRKSTPLLVIGVAVFVIGSGLAFVALQGTTTGSSSQSKRTPVPTTTVAGSPASPRVAATASPSSVPGAAALDIPAGKNALAVELPLLQGLDGFAKAGDLINIYANIAKKPINIPGLASPETKLIATNVAVLGVLSGAPSAAPTGTAVYLLALDATQAEQVIFFTTYESLYFTLVPKNSPPAVTPGRSYQNAI